MNKLLIVRSSDPKLTNDKGTFGTFYWNGTKLGVTCEQPWNNNLKGKSCIPEGIYQCVPHDSPNHPNVVAFINPELNVYHYESDIPQSKKGIARSVCLIHNANWPFQLEGCVAVGKDYFFDIKNGNGVNNSVITLDKLRSLWGDRNFTVEIIKGK